MLRGINVGGHNKVAMADLRRLFEDLGYTDVATYVQSGNVIYRSPKAKGHEAAIGNAIASTFGIDVTVLIRTGAQLKAVLAGNPFPTADVKQLHVTFLGNVTDASLAAGVPTSAGAPDEFVIDRSVIYLHCPGGYGTTKLNNGFWERKLKVPATTRNWTTVTNLVALASA
jgi:uncharacterized protein (DUF1697 family)